MMIGRSVMKARSLMSSRSVMKCGGGCGVDFLLLFHNFCTFHHHYFKASFHAIHPHFII